MKINFTEIVGLSGRKIRLNGQIAEGSRPFDLLVRPRNRLSPGALRYFGLTHEKLEKSPSLRDVFSELKTWIAGSVLISRYAAFEFYALSCTLDDFRLDPPSNPVFDPFYMARYIHPRSWTKVLEPLNPQGKNPPVEEKLDNLAKVASPLLRELQKKGHTTVQEALPFGSPKSVSRAYSFVHQVLHDAYMRRLSVLIEYPQHGAAPGASSKHFDRRKVDIFGFRLPFFVGYCHMRRAMRTFRIERIRRFQLLPESGYTIPGDFHLGNYFLGFHPGARESSHTTNVHLKE